MGRIRSAAAVVVFAVSVAGCSGFLADSPPPWVEPGMPVRCDDSGHWAVTDLALATLGIFLLVNSEGKGIDTYAASAGTLVFAASSGIGFRRAHDCRCLHKAWLERARLR